MTETAVTIDHATLAFADIAAARVLVVDDQEANVLLLQDLLADAGYSNVTATMLPETVCAMHRQHAYDLILLDLHMPLMDGFEVMQALKASMTDPYLPVIVLTADPALKVRALQAGAKDFISKPFDLVEVKTRIRNMLEVRLLYKKLAGYNQLLEATVMQRTAELRHSEERFRRLTELASDWYWEQNETGNFTTVSGPLFETLGIRVTSFFGEKSEDEAAGWDESERAKLRAMIDARAPFLDYAFSRTHADGTRQTFRVSGEPMFSTSGRFTGYRGIGVETTPGR